VIGAGISGPAAALALADAGHCVTLYERRRESEITSTDVIGITNANIAALESHGVDMASVTLPSFFTNWNDGNPVTKPFIEEEFFQWSDLHTVILDAAKRKGVVCRFGTERESNVWVTVQASGVGYASWSGLKAHYTGHVVYQGLSSMNSEFSWLNVDDPQNRFSLKLARTRSGKATWNLFVHRSNPAMRSVDLSTDELPAECEFVPQPFRDVLHSATKLAVRPISDWDIPDDMVRGDCITIGDANGAMRPMSAMGANLGISEAMCVPYIMNRPHNDTETVKELVANRKRYSRIGAAMGRKALGE
jgi:2-polyprenyl-6-methoxyphenol hydroxylase-like FAD-dependent oxidoreductase